MIDYSGQIPINFTPLRIKEWKRIDGAQPFMGINHRFVRDPCVDCGAMIAPPDMETMDGQHIYKTRGNKS